MKRLLVLAFVVAGAIVAYKYLDKKSELNTDQTRVEEMLQAMRDNDEQRALCLWALNQYATDADTMRAYYDRYLRFAEETGLRVGTSWTVGEVVRDDAAHTTTISVNGPDGRVRLLVRPYVPIEVAPAP